VTGFASFAGQTKWYAGAVLVIPYESLFSEVDRQRAVSPFAEALIHRLVDILTKEPN